jgi:hypothetical protein
MLLSGFTNSLAPFDALIPAKNWSFNAEIVPSQLKCRAVIASRVAALCAKGSRLALILL